MNAAPATADRAQDLAQRDPERGRLLGLVRKLMDYGRGLVATLQNRNTPDPPLGVAHRFGTLTLALIIARITRGLMIAAALESRLLHPRPRSATPTPRTPRSTPRAGRTPRQPLPDEEAELLGKLPSAREIAARMRNRKTGAVIVEICRDLGIATDHPLWRQINEAIIFNGGNTCRLMRVWFARAGKSLHLPLTQDDIDRHDYLMAALTNPS